MLPHHSIIHDLNVFPKFHIQYISYQFSNINKKLRKKLDSNTLGLYYPAFINNIKPHWHWLHQVKSGLAKVGRGLPGSHYHPACRRTQTFFPHFFWHSTEGKAQVWMIKWMMAEFHWAFSVSQSWCHLTVTTYWHWSRIIDCMSRGVESRE